VVLDEATAHLDAASTAVVESGSTGFAADGRTVLMVGHDAARSRGSAGTGLSLLLPYLG
jgi:ABC-type transport system involved in cytochrome bd biosynthesis fused ATPase/permease subunit